MTRLPSRLPAQDYLPLEIGSCRLAEVACNEITWLAPYRGRLESVSDALQKELGCAFPEPNRMTRAGSVSIISVGPDEALVLGAAPSPDGATVVDQTGGWAVMTLSGEQSREVLSRLTSVDLRSDVFLVGHTARTFIGHMTASLTRIEDNLWEVLVFRSMAGTAAREFERAMNAVAARQALT